jgi:transposase-like protein
MSRTPVPATKIAAAKNLFLAGKTLSQVAKETGLSESKLRKVSMAENWGELKNLNQTELSLPALHKSVEIRAESIHRAWRDQVEPLCNVMLAIASRISVTLDNSSMDGLDVRELATMVKILVDSVAKLRDTVGDKKETQAPMVLVINREAGK